MIKPAISPTDTQLKTSMCNLVWATESLEMKTKGISNMDLEMMYMPGINRIVE